MANPLILFDKPKAGLPSLPTLSIAGTLAKYKSGAAYKSTLDIINGIGKCKVELTEGELPGDGHVFVNNLTKEIVVQWSAFSSEPTDEIINGGFEDGADGWKLGYGFYVGSGTGNQSAYEGTKSLRHNNFKGTSISEGAMTPVPDDFEVEISGWFQQGASGVEHTSGRIGLRWYDGDRQKVGDNWGNLIIRGDRGAWHTSTLSRLPPPNAVYVAPILESTRTKTNLVSQWDAITWNLSRAVGYTGDGEFPITLKVTDSAHRVAFWTGTIEQQVSLYHLAWSLLQSGPGANNTNGTMIGYPNGDILWLGEVSDTNAWLITNTSGTPVVEAITLPYACGTGCYSTWHESAVLMASSTGENSYDAYDPYTNVSTPIVTFSGSYPDIPLGEFLLADDDGNLIWSGYSMSVYGYWDRASNTKSYHGTGYQPNNMMAAYCNGYFCFVQSLDAFTTRYSVMAATEFPGPDFNWVNLSHADTGNSGTNVSVRADPDNGQFVFTQVGNSVRSIWTVPIVGGTATLIGGWPDTMSVSCAGFLFDPNNGAYVGLTSNTSGYAVGSSLTEWTYTAGGLNWGPYGNHLMSGGKVFAHSSVGLQIGEYIE